ncbi:hypothetical protein CY35_04G072400 [Sphagnum magellanicum]|nr:hypothetical protein CY35_04G072400 [Sphagnum magellanicum]
MARKLELGPSSDLQRQCGKLVAFFHLHFDAETVGMQTVVSTHIISHRKNIAICDLSDTSQKRESAESVSQLICYGRKKIVFNMCQCCGFEIEIKIVASAQSSIAVSCCRAMINEKQSQSILVSGRPGQGKQKLIVKAYMGGLAATDGRTVERQVLEV